MKAMAGATGEVYLFPVKEQWHASLYILIRLFHISLHKAESKKERSREKEGGRGVPERLNFIEGQFEVASG